MKRWGVIAGAVLLGLVALGGLGWVALGRVNLGPVVAWWASRTLGRAVTVREAHVVPGRWLAVQLAGVVVPNKEGGSDPVMARLRRGRAEVEAISVLWGPLVVRGAEVEGLSILLEHVADGSPNWRSGPTRPPSSERGGFPSLRDLHGREIEYVQRTRSGHRLVTRVEEWTFRSPADEQPVRLTATGSYNGTPLQLEADLQSIAAYRRAETPFGTSLRLRSGPVSLVFDGTMTQPLALEGAEGRLTLEAPALTPLVAIAGGSGEVDVSLRLAGRFRHSGALWWLTEAGGALEESVVTAGSLRLIEGDGAKLPDNLGLDLTFKSLDLNEVLGAGARGKRSGADTSLSVDRAPTTVVSARVKAGTLAYDATRATEVMLVATVEPGRVAVEELGLTAFGTRVRGHGAVVAAAGERGRVTAEVTADGADLQTMRRAFGFGDVPVTGRLEGVFEAEATARTLNEAMRNGRVSGVVAMRGGGIARDVVEKASTDLRALFRRAKGMSAVRCLLAGLDMRAGVGTVAPLRVRSADGTVAGSARFDLNRRVFDLTIGSESRTTGAFALDVPVRVSGSFASPSVAPGTWSAEGRAALAAADDTSRLPGPLREMVRRYPCPAGER